MLSVTNTTYTVAVKARPVSTTFTNAVFTLHIAGRASSVQLLGFDSSSLTVTNAVTETNLAPGSWRFYQVEVPTNALGWDVRVLDGGTNTLTMVVRRDNQPNQAKTVIATGSTWSSPGTATAWPSNYQWAAGWTGRGARFRPSAPMKAATSWPWAWACRLSLALILSASQTPRAAMPCPTPCSVAELATAWPCR